jgi:hypothetical protein
VSARRVPPQKGSIPPAIPHHQTIVLLRRQADRADQIASLRFDDPQTEVWLNSTINILNQAFGQPNGKCTRTRKMLRMRRAEYPCM